MSSYNLTHLKELESEAIFILREVAAQFEKPVMLFSGGKDSIIMFHLARKAFYPGKVPFPLMHVDTGHNFPETIEFRDRLMEETGGTLIIKYVQDSIDNGTAVEETGINASRNGLQTVTLLEGLEEGKYDISKTKEVPHRIKQFGYENILQDIYNKADEAYKKLVPLVDQDVATYVLTNGHKRHINCRASMKEMYAMSRLREDAHAQWRKPGGGSKRGQEEPGSVRRERASVLCVPKQRRAALLFRIRLRLSRVGLLG